MTPRVLDLYCGEGGAAKGYHDVGFDVYGIDTNAKRLQRYPYECDQADALDFLARHGSEFDLIHASPPCQGYSVATAGRKDRDRYTLGIGITRDALEAVGKPYIIENVQGAKYAMRRPILLCGRMFGLYTWDSDGTLLVLDRHRLFESNLRLLPKAHPPHHRGRISVAGAYGGGTSDRQAAKKIRRGGYTPNLARRHQLLDVAWMSQIGASLAIPPAYTYHLGKQALTQCQ